MWVDFKDQKHCPRLMSLVLGPSCRAADRRRWTVSREHLSHLLPPSGSQSPGLPGSSALLGAYSGAPAGTRAEPGGLCLPVAAVCMELSGRKRVSDFCTRTSSVSSVLLATPLQNYLKRNQSTLDSEEFSFHLTLKEQESDFAKNP